jgi:homoserine O-succinyltransferase
VIYWGELKKILEWSENNVTSIFHLCWGAQAGLYYHYSILKRMIEEKMFGVFRHHRTVENVDLLRGFDEEYSVPHSRYFEVKREDIEGVSELQIILESEESEINIIMSRDGKQIFVIGHSEYAPFKLKEEYLRDLEKGEKIQVSKMYIR